MISSKLRFFGMSGATCAEAWDRITYTASGATMIAPETEPAYGQRTLAARRRSSLRSIIVATMLPLRAFDELAFRRRHGYDNVNSYVYFLGEEESDLLESPAIVVVWPKRQTFRFRSGRPARRLPPRLPFIPPRYDR